MNASEKAAWLQLAVCATAIVVVALLFPWMGQRATAGFAVLGLITLTAIYYRRCGNRVIVDERDREIEQRTTSIAVGATWMGLITILAVAGMWSSYSDIHTVSARFLNWLIWGQFVAYFAIKAVGSIVLYRSQRYAT